MIGAVFTGIFVYACLHHGKGKPSKGNTKEYEMPEVGLFSKVGVEKQSRNREADSSYGAMVSGGIAGFIACGLLTLGSVYFFPNPEDNDGGFSIALFIVVGLIVGGIGAGIWELRHSRLSVQSIMQGVVGGGIGAVIGLVVVFFIALAMMGG